MSREKNHVRMQNTRMRATDKAHDHKPASDMKQVTMKNMKDSSLLEEINCAATYMAETKCLLLYQCNVIILM